MKKISKNKMRVLRTYLNIKKNFFLILWFGLVTTVFCVGVYNVFKTVRWEAARLYHIYIADDQYDAYNYSIPLGDNYEFYDNGPHGYIKDINKDKKVLKDVRWICQNTHSSDDSLLVFASKSYRGYFNLKSGCVQIEANRFNKAWVFSEGLAAVVMDGKLQFIRPDGQLAFRTFFCYDKQAEERDYMFRNGYCQVKAWNGHWGIIDKNGSFKIAPVYDDIRLESFGYWLIEKDGRKGLLDEKLEELIEPIYIDVRVEGSWLEALQENYVRLQLDLRGNITKDFTYTAIEDLYYKTDVKDPSTDEYTWKLSPYKMYSTTYAEDEGPVGLLGPDGHPVTLPLYSKIEAVSNNVFRCFIDNTWHHEEGEGLSILIDNKGREISNGKLKMEN